LPIEAWVSARSSSDEVGEVVAEAFGELQQRAAARVAQGEVGRGHGDNAG
jgi:hypothetical protein